MSVPSGGRTCQTVVNCYSLFHSWFPNCGMLDYSDGIYHGDPNTSYEQAQRNQINHLLDEVRCGAGTRILDIGCGYGTLLEQAAARGARATGITISPEQARHGTRRGLDVHLIDYRDLGDDWTHRFDAIVANGSIEHFARPADALRDDADVVYRRLFEICRRVIDPASPVQRMVSTTIHFLNRPDPQDLLKPPSRFPRGSDRFHYALLTQSFGGWYPVPGQLERCAEARFDLVEEVDGTHDYHLTSEDWLRRVRAEIKRPRAALRVFAGSLPFMIRHPRQFLTMVRCMLITESWNWQFRPPNPPTRLLRQTWTCCG